MSKRKGKKPGLSQEAARTPLDQPLHFTPRKRVISLFLGVWLVLLFVDALPVSSLFHRRLKDWVHPFLSATGLWQGSWQLFAPEVDKIDVRVTAEISYADGSVRTWTSPDWRDMSAWEKFIHFREMEYFDSVRRDMNSGAWESLADFLARNVSAPGDSLAKPTNIKLSRLWSDVPPLEGGLKVPYWKKRAFDGPYVLLRKDY